jgi:uncharacterized Fe-S cluster-containing radical SAM superfamily protein
VTYDIDEVAKLYRDHVIDAVVNIDSSNQVNFRDLQEKGIEDIYYISLQSLRRLELGEDISSAPVLVKYRDALPELFHMEMHLADHCNLNCRGCTHFSNLVDKEVFIDKDQFKKDIELVVKHFSYIDHFFLMGGEPLLNKDIASFVRIIREMMPYTRLVVVTNGILLPKMTQETIEVFRQCNAKISVSAYQGLDFGKIVEFVDKYQIFSELRLKKDHFIKYMNQTGDSDKVDVFDKCARKICTFVENGRIACCCQPFKVHYFNEYFDKHIPENETMDLLDDSLDPWEFAYQLQTPMETCRYCTYEEKFDWQLSKGQISIEDWCVK